MKSRVTRLFESFQPENYQLHLDFDRDNMKFGGQVVIAGRKTGRPTKRLVLHQNGLEISDAKIVRKNRKEIEEIEITRINRQNSYDEVRLHTKELLFPGEYTVTLRFKGSITEPMTGLYPCFFNYGGKEQKLLATQFESHHAREVFPCIDEPEAKATFDISVDTDKGETVLSNSTVKNIKNADRQTTIFNKTPKMSTYLVAIVYGNLGFKEAKTKRGTVIRTYATPDNVRLTGFALECAVKCLEYYEDYFGIAYPLEKCDLVGLPDFSNGAMENWGLVTFREQCLFVDPKNTSLGTKQFVAMVVAHELAHQWFGNLVTMRWWTDLWLNEGFASWVEYMAVDHMFPEWEMWVQFIASEQQTSMKLDALDNTHAIEVPVKHPDEIHSIFDAISYGKGASIIHMLHGYLGKEAFREGLRYYLKNHAYDNTDTKDLWQALEDKSGLPVKEIMQAWTSQPGFPLIKADIKGNTIKLSQQRFYIHEPAVISPSIWPVPLLSDHIDLKRLDSKEANAKTKKSGLLKLNQGESGFYRTVYDSQSLAKLAKAIKDDQLSELDRLGILADSFEAAKAGLVEITDCLDLLSAYKLEENSAVWDIIAANLSEIRRAMDDEKLREQFKPFIISLTSKELKRLGWEEKPKDSHFDKLLRPTILGLSSAADEPNVVKEALKRFKEMKSSEDIPADVRSIVYATVAHHGDEKTFDKLMEMHNSTNSSEEKNILTAALTSFKQPELLKKALSNIKSTNVKKQDVMYWLAYCLSNFYGKRLAWEWLVKNWQWLRSQMGKDMSFYRVPVYSARSFSSPEFLKEFTEFFTAHSTPALERSIKQGIEILNWQIDWKQRDFKKIADYLKTNHG